MNGAETKLDGPDASEWIGNQQFWSDTARLRPKAAIDEMQWCGSTTTCAMSDVRQADLRRFSDVVWELNSAVSPADLSNHLLRGISRLINVDRVSYNEVDRRGGKLIRAHSLGEADNPALVASLNAHIGQHPGFNRADSNADFPAPTKLSDTLSQRQFRELGLYREHFKLYGIHYQLGASFAMDADRKLSFGLNRQKRDFSERDRVLIDLLRPHLRRVCQQTRAAAEMHAALGRREHALENAREALVFLDDLGQMEFATARALELLQVYGRKNRNLAAGVRSPMPAPVARWFRQQKSGWPLPAPGGGDGTSSSWAIRQGGGELRLELVAASQREPETWKPRRRWLLKLSERPVEPSAAPLRQLGLSEREAEVLLWLAQGKRNSEIASICRLRPSTVATHVRNIFPKLGVETRTAAAASAWQTLIGGAFLFPR
jgi:DNA-binding CsgD family transcriptional regulator